MKVQATVMISVAVTMEIEVNENVTTIEDVANNVIQECDYNFTASEDSNGTIVDTEIVEVDTPISSTLI
jgi:hypothetical protein